MLKITGLTKRFDNFELGPADFSLPRGYIMGLIGANGAGKTTIIKLILNMLEPDGGEIKLFGKDNIAEESEVKQHLGVVFDNNMFVDAWTVKDIGKALSGFYRFWDDRKFSALLKRFELPDNKPVKDFSRGMQMKLMLAAAMAHDAKLLILDEPTSGLDPSARDMLMEILLEYIADGAHSVLFSTHITSDLERIADYITFVDSGKLLYTGSKDEFVDGMRAVKGGPGDLTPELKSKLIGLRSHAQGFEGLIRAGDARLFGGLIIEPVSIDEIMVYTGRGHHDTGRE